MEQEQDQTQDVLPTPVESAPAEGEPEVEPTKSVKNFWERLDEVFAQSSQMKERMEELVSQFPEISQPQNKFTSFIFQPERISLCSNDDVQPNTEAVYVSPQVAVSPTAGHLPAEKFSSFRIRLNRPLRNVKSIQLLSAVIPNAIQNIPDEQVFFFWYKIRSVAMSLKGVWVNTTPYEAGDIVTFLGNTFVAIQPNTNYQPTGGQLGVWWFGPIQLPADTTRPNYYDINPYNELDHGLQYLLLTPTYFFPYEGSPAGNQQLYNRTFQDYGDLVNSLNYIMLQGVNNSSQNDISFEYDDFLNKVIMVPSPANITSGYYYLPCGYEDPNINTFMSSTQPILCDPYSFPANEYQYLPGYTLNLRIGFTWNGRYTNPFMLSNPWNDQNFLTSVFWYLRKKDPGYYPYVGPPTNPPYLNNWFQDSITFNSYPDLVNTSCVRLYADFTLASTQDSLDSTNSTIQPQQQGLLSIVPVNTTNLGVGFYQNNFSNPLTKIPDNLTEIGISMLTDQGLPYYLPNSATVLLELAVTYK